MDRSGKIIHPGNFRVDEGSPRNDIEAAIANNPTLKFLMQQIGVQDAKSKQMILDLQMVYNSFMTLSVQFNALLDYMVRNGHLKDGEPTFDALLAEHAQLAEFLPLLRQKQQKEGYPMKQAIEDVREFNLTEGRLLKIRGDQFGLHVWLSKNPNNLSDEELEDLASEFALQKHDDGAEIIYDIDEEKMYETEKPSAEEVRQEEAVPTEEDQEGEGA